MAQLIRLLKTAIVKLWELIHAAGIWVSKMTFVVFRLLGEAFSFFLPKEIKRNGRVVFRVIPKDEDHEDSHTFKHFSMCMIGTLVLHELGLSLVAAVFLSFVIAWLGWELLIDGFRISDARGYQMSDVGADLVGALMPWLISIIF